MPRADTGGITNKIWSYLETRTPWAILLMSTSFPVQVQINIKNTFCINSHWNWIIHPYSKCKRLTYIINIYCAFKYKKKICGKSKVEKIQLGLWQRHSSTWYPTNWINHVQLLYDNIIYLVKISHDRIYHECEIYISRKLWSGSFGIYFHDENLTHMY